MINVLAAFGVIVVAAKALAIYRALTGDRDGNSGRFKHWTKE